MDQFLLDTFSGETANVTLQSHTGEVGATWTKTALATGDLSVSYATNAVYSASGQAAVYTASGVPVGANYSVKAGIFWTEFLMSNISPGIVGRCDPAAANFYGVRYYIDRWVLYKTVGGVYSVLDEYVAAWPTALNVEVVVELILTDEKKSVSIDGVADVLVSTDNSIPGAGSAGLRLIALSATSNRSRIGYIEANDISTTPPTAVISVDDDTPAVNQQITLDGSSSTGDGGISAYLWEILNKPLASTATPVTPAGQTTTFTPDVSGLYVFKLTVTDGDSLTNYTITSFYCQDKINRVATDGPTLGTGDSFLVGATSRRSRVVAYGGKFYSFFFRDNADPWDIYGIMYDPATSTVSGPYLLGSATSDDAHNFASPAVDSQGYFHVAYGAHHTQLMYRKSTNPGDISAWGAEVNVTGAAYATYPCMMITPDDEPYILFRSHGDGSATSEQNAVKFATRAGGTWASGWIVQDATGLRMYPMAVQSGSKISLMWTVRFANADSSEDFRHVFYAETADGGATWKTSGGSTYTLPLTEANAEKVVDGVGNYLAAIPANAGGTIYAVVAYDGPADNIFREAKSKLLKGTNGTWTAYQIHVTADLDPGGVLSVRGDSLVYYTQQYVMSMYQVVRFVSADGGVTWTGPERISAPNEKHNAGVSGSCGWDGDTDIVLWSSETDVWLYSHAVAISATETLDTLITSIASVADQQAYRESVDTLIESGATVDAVTGMVEALLSLGVSASTAADVQGYADGVSDTIVSASDTADAQAYVDGPATTGVSSSDESDTQAYTDTLADTLVSASNVTDTTGAPPLAESLLTTAVSASNVAAAQAYVDTVTALAVSASSLGGVLGLLEQLGTVGESISAVSDRQLYYDNVAIVAISNSSLAEVGAYIEQVSAAAVSASSLTDVLVGSFVGRYVFADYCRPRSFEDYCRPRGRRLQ